MRSRISLPRFRLGAAALGALAAVAACGDTAGLPPPAVENVVDTAIVFALTGTEIGTPSGFDVIAALPARPEQLDPYDFVFDIDTAGTALLMPSLLVGLSSSAGLLKSSQSFDAITRAPLEDYVPDTALVVTEGTVFLARSRSSQEGCSAYLGAIPRYGKFEVVAVDLDARTVTLQHMINLNCGYRDLQPGLPDQ